MEPGTFEVIPTFRLQKRRLLGPDGARREEPAVERVRERAAKGMVCVVDHDGLRRNKADLDTLRKMAEKGNVWADAGSRFATDAMDLLVAGAERATLRWASLGSEAELREAQEFSDSMVLGLEFRHGFVRNTGMPGDEERALALARELGMGIVVIDLARDGTRTGVDRALAARFGATGLDRWFAGGARDATDARELEALGYRGLLVGTAMVEGSWA